MNKWIKKAVFGTCLFTATIVTSLNLSALTIVETTNPDDNFDSIIDNSIVMGITKFEPDVVLTALRASNATFNDVIFNYGNDGYKGVKIYYYLSGTWFEIDEENEAHVISDEAVIQKLNKLDIYYINNKEKMLELSYSKELKDGYELVYKTNNAEKDKLVKFENGKLSIPATVKKLELFVKNTESGEEQSVDVFEKEELNDIIFNRMSSEGSIAKGDATGGDLEYTVDGNKITINGSVKWYGADAGAQNGRKPGNYASVKISASDKYTKEDLLANTKLTIDDRETITWGDVIDESLGEDVFFTLYPRFDENTKSHKVVVEWVDGNVQTFIIELGENATLESAPAGKIEKGDATGGELEYTVNEDKITIDGNVKWYEADANAQNGRKAGNYASVKISANEVYTKEFLDRNTKVTIDGKTVVEWKDIVDATIGEDVFFTLYPRFDENTKSHTISIEWENGNVQTFVIELADTATLESAPAGTIEKGDTTGGELEYTVDGSKITIDGNVKWYGSDDGAQNGRTAGNYASVKISAPELYTREMLVNSAKVTIDDRETINWETITDSSIGEDVFFTLYPRFDENTKSHTVTIEWENGNTQTFVIELADTATLEEAAVGTIVKGDATGGDLEYTVDGNKITIDGDVKWYGADATAQNGRKAGNYASVKISANEAYTREMLVSNAKVTIDDRETINWETITDSSIGEDVFFVLYPRFDENTKSHKVTIEWENGNTQTFAIELSENATLESAPKGTIAKGDATGGELEYTVDGNKVTINGNVKWYGADENAQNGRKPGNYASVKISANEMYTKEFLDSNTKVTIDGKTIVDWKDIVDTTIGEDVFFVLYPRFDENTKSHTVSIEWENGNTQVFTIELDANATLESAPKGTIAKGDATGGDLEYTVDGNKITIDGDVKWYGADANAQNGRKAGNYASVKISANEVYSKEFLDKNTKITIDDRETITWGEIIDESLGEDVFFTLYPRFDENTKSHKVTIEWENGNTQTFAIELSENATLESAPKGTIAKGDATGGDLEYTIDGNKVTINGTMKWYEADENAQNGRKAGNYASVKISANEAYTREMLVSNAKVTIDDRETINWETITDSSIGEDVFFVLYPRFDENTKSHTVTIEWENGNTQTFTIELGESIVLEPEQTI